MLTASSPPASRPCPSELQPPGQRRQAEPVSAAAVPLMEVAQSRRWPTWCRATGACAPGALTAWPSGRCGTWATAGAQRITLPQSRCWRHQRAGAHTPARPRSFGTHSDPEPRSFHPVLWLLCCFFKVPRAPRGSPVVQALVPQLSCLESSLRSV